MANPFTTITLSGPLTTDVNGAIAPAVPTGDTQIEGDENREHDLDYLAMLTLCYDRSTYSTRI
jgi:hypothetical protein